MSGLEIIRAIQSINNPVLDVCMCTLSEITGSETLYMVIGLLAYWVYDKRLGRYLASVMILGRWFNSMLKWELDTARPSPADVRVLCEETGPDPAFPSGHSQLPMMFFGAIAMQLRIKWVTVSLAVLIFLVGFSRLYLGVHWPLDVLGGWAIGAVLLWGFQSTQGFWMGDNMSLGRKLLWAVVIPLATLVIWRIVISPATYWNTPAAEAGEIWKLAGGYVGFWVGSVLEEQYVGFNPRLGGPLAHVVKVVVGVLLVLVVKEGLKAVLPDLAISDLIRYTALAFAGTYLAPWLFRRFITAPPAGRSIAQ